MKLLIVILAICISKGKVVKGKNRFFTQITFVNPFKASRIRVHQTKSIRLGPREDYLIFSSGPKEMSGSCFLRDKIHLSVNGSSSETSYQYSKVISISRLPQGRKGWSNREGSLLWCHEFWFQISHPRLGIGFRLFLHSRRHWSLFDERRFQCDKVWWINLHSRRWKVLVFSLGVEIVLTGHVERKREVMCWRGIELDRRDVFWEISLIFFMQTRRWGLKNLLLLASVLEV